MPWPPQNRVSPSGPFAPTGGDLDGYVRRIWYATGPKVVVDVPEDTNPPGETLIDVPVVLTAADDLPDLRWTVEATARYTIEADDLEDPVLFSMGLVIGLQAAGAVVPTTYRFVQSPGWPYYPDDDNQPVYNVGVVQTAWDIVHYPWLVGTNHVTLGLCFFGGGVHEAHVGIGMASMIVREYRGPTLTVL